MRPHTVAYIAILLYFQQQPSSEVQKFFIELVIRGTTKQPTRRYDIRVLKRKGNQFELKTSGMWTCTAEIDPRYANSEDKFRITHNHNRQVTEEITIYTHRVEGRYSGHSQYTNFYSTTNEPETLKFTTTATKTVYEVTEFKVL